MTANPRIPSLCFVAHFAFGALSGGRVGHIGGVERQTALMARWFSARGYRVSVITWDEDQPDDLVLDGIRVVKVCRQSAGLPGLRFLHPRWTSLVRALRHADADIYYHNCAEYVTGQVMLWCRLRGRRFVYSVASEPDCNPQLPDMALRERLLYRYGLHHADRVIAQTHTQARMLREGFARAALVIPMPGIDMSGAVAPPSTADGPRVLWLGRLTQVKRPDRLLELARSCPELQFDLVGPPDGTAYAANVVQQALGFPNVTVRGRVEAREVGELLQRALCLVSTSDHEGFPNTFLEAWSASVPVCSTIDPDEVLAGFGLGMVARDVPDLATSLRALAAAPALRSAMAERARRYYLQHHSVDRVLPRFESLFLELARPPGWPTDSLLVGGNVR